jgi:hypothetical protein
MFPHGGHVIILHSIITNYLIDIIYISKISCHASFKDFKLCFYAGIAQAV